MSDSLPVYRASSASHTICLRQGEVLSDVSQVKLKMLTIGTTAFEIEIIQHPFAIVLAQDCDLEQDFRVRQAGTVNDKLIPNVLFCEVASAVELYSLHARSQEQWKDRLHIPKNKNERFQFLERVPVQSDAQSAGLTEMGIDFKRCFTVPTDETYRRIELGEIKRRCVLCSPYLEHLSSRFAYFLSRVALPSDHASEPGV